MRVNYSDLEAHEREAIARIALEFASCQRDIDAVNSELESLVRRQELVIGRLDGARKEYSELEASMVKRLGGKFDLVADDEALKAAIMAMIGA